MSRGLGRVYEALETAAVCLWRAPERAIAETAGVGPEIQRVAGVVRRYDGVQALARHHPPYVGPLRPERVTRASAIDHW